MLLFSGHSIGIMAFGAMIDAVGMRWSFRIGGIISMVTCALFALLHNLLPHHTPEAETEENIEFKDVKEHLQSHQKGSVEHKREEGEEGKLCLEVEK